MRVSKQMASIHCALLLLLLLSSVFLKLEPDRQIKYGFCFVLLKVAYCMLCLSKKHTIRYFHPARRT